MCVCVCVCVCASVPEAALMAAADWGRPSAMASETSSPVSRMSEVQQTGSQMKQLPLRPTDVSMLGVIQEEIRLCVRTPNQRNNAVPVKFSNSCQ